jgi:hypothetical protein
MNKRVLLIPGVLLLVAAAASADPVEMPDKGSPLRKAILDGLRATEPVQKLSREWHAKIVFTNVTIRRSGDWAWVSAAPISADNKNHFEAVSGVMHQAKGQWQMVEFVSDEIASADDPDKAFQQWCENFAKTHAGCSAAIFPPKP